MTPDVKLESSSIKMGGSFCTEAAARRHANTYRPSANQAINLILLTLLCPWAPGGRGALGQQAASFPGVTRDLASFCSARPSLSIELASMVVHVKRAASFNYKLYLFSSDNYVFQTGQIVPRADFRIHAFPVKVKHFNDFWPASVPLVQLDAGALVQLPSSQFSAKRFLAPVPIHDKQADGPRRQRTPRQPGQPRGSAPQHERPAAASGEPAHVNAHIQFDRDDQLALLDDRRLGGQWRDSLTSRRDTRALEESSAADDAGQRPGQNQFVSNQQLVVPVAAFSSFHVNLTYLVRKDFDQAAPELVRLQVDPARFQVSQVELVATGANASLPDDCAFLGHRLLRDPNTRITAVSQIYEDWITRNFYTVVYIQRRLEAPGGPGEQAPEVEWAEPRAERAGRRAVVTDRLVFRASSALLLGADQLDYQVKASAFITEKNGLHYYLEFLSSGQFYVGAVDWSKRPFAILDAQRLPMRQTSTKLDNEELLLCPPALCYSERPVDELAAYGRLALPPALQLEASVLTRALSQRAPAANDQHAELALSTAASLGAGAAGHSSALINLDALVEAVRAAASQLEVRLHLRDWTWSLPRLSSSVQDELPVERHAGPANRTAEPAGRFGWHFEWARRNDIKAVPDSYGFALTGHEIDASYRLYNELYLISANQLIAINYTLANETATSVQPLDEEFQGLSSSLLDPITGAYYDRYANELYFFKGDRYVGYDYATKRPLEDFVLPAPRGPGSQEAAGAQMHKLVSSLPVVGLLGRQHHVDADYHDLHDDMVYVFAADKFYHFHAADFKDGAFRAARQPAMRCINEHFLQGCRFDQAYPNPCRAVDEQLDGHGEPAAPSGVDRRKLSAVGNRLALDLQRDTLEFSDEQQTKLRSIAARGGGLLDVLLDGTLVNRAAVEPILMPMAPGQAGAQERIVVYLLVAMVLVTIFVTVAMIFVILNWARVRAGQPSSADELAEEPDELKPAAGEQALKERIAYPPAISQYLANQYHHRLQQQQAAPLYYHQGRHAAARYVAAPAERQFGPDRQASQPPLSPPPPPPVAQSRAFRTPTKRANSSRVPPNSPNARPAPSRHGQGTIVDSSAL